MGEAGRETVLPLSNPRTMRNVGEAIAEAGGMGDQMPLIVFLAVSMGLVMALFTLLKMPETVDTNPLNTPVAVDTRA